MLPKQGMLLSPRPVPAPNGPTGCTRRRASFPRTPPRARDAKQHLSLPAVSGPKHLLGALGDQFASAGVAGGSPCPPGPAPACRPAGLPAPSPCHRLSKTN